MLPNPNAPRDDEVYVIQYTDSGSSRRVIFFNYACHADTLGVDINVITSEFPGAARSVIEGVLPQTTAVYLPGCAAEINPNVVNEKGEFFGTYDDVLRLGRSLADEVLRALGKPAMASFASTLDCRSSTLVVSQVPIHEWYSRIPDPTLADAVLDRLIHNAHQLNLEGESQRKLRAIRSMSAT